MELEDKALIFAVEETKQAMMVQEHASAVLVEKYDLELIDDIIDAISIPVIASCRVGHFVDASILQKIGVAIVDESIPSSMKGIEKKNFSIPFISVAENIAEARERADEGAKYVRTPWMRVEELVGFIEEMKDITAKKIASLVVAYPSDIALLFRMGVDAVLISSRVFHSPNPPKLIEAFYETKKYYMEDEKILAVTKALGNVLTQYTSEINI